MDTAGWAPQFKSLHLLNEAGRVLVVKNKSELKQVNSVALKEAALLSVCDGNKSLTRGYDATFNGAVPAAIRFNVVGLGFMGYFKLTGLMVLSIASGLLENLV